MHKHIWMLLILATTVTLIAAQSWAHVPYFEDHDFSEKQPFRVEYSIEQSMAIYAWLEINNLGYSEDIDVYVFQVDEPADIYVEVLVPVCRGYEDFLPWYALVGPGLPEMKTSVPFDIQPDQGIVLRRNLRPGEPRDVFYEFFGGKSYYKGPIFEDTFAMLGTYYVYVWDPLQKGGDYVVVLGKKETWRFQDIVQAFRNTPLIRLDRELHIKCSD
jgi:hypothetical protein